MLNSLSIQNFQSHKKTELEFDPGINVITGASDSGKTAVIRALRWLIYNRPGGEAFRSSWGGDAIIDLALDNGQIQRIKTNKDNLYVLGYHDEFKAFGTDVPEEIQQVLNLNTVNIQQQLDRPFLLDDSSGEVAGHFNRMAHLDVIDRGLQNVQKWQRSIEQDIKSGNQYQIELQEDLKTYDYLDQMEIEVEVLEQIENHKISIIQKIQKLKALIYNIEDVNVQIEKSSKLLPAEKQVDSILALFKQESDLKEKKQTLSSIITKLLSVQLSIEENQEIIQHEKQVDKILSLYSIQDEQIRKTEGLASLIDNINSTKEQIKEKELQILEMEQDFDYYIGDTCPLCGQEIK
jgi:DNA repair protein SbcC/Rad50